jgi:5S rRNA maturation endonuclease (ribonuclease M5)
MSEYVDRIVEAFQSAGGDPCRHEAGWRARCRVSTHGKRRGDINRSVSIWEREDGSAGVHCHAGCAVEGVLAAVGLSAADLAPPKVGASRIVVQYDYTDESGRLLFQVVRADPKGFRQRRPDGRGGWIWNLRGVRRVLYRLPAVLEAVKAGTTIYVVEGEKDVERCETAGLVATCNPGGAGKWSREYTETLRGAHVVIVADWDAPGRAHALRVARELDGVAQSVRILRAAAGKDAHDHFTAGKTAEDFIPIEVAELQAEDDSGASTPTASGAEAVPPWTSFPTNLLPSPLDTFVHAAAHAIGCDEAFIAAPLLAALAGCIGNRAVLQLKPGWPVPAVLWVAVVADSGSHKTPALSAVLDFLHTREAIALRNHEASLQDYRLRLDLWRETKKEDRGERPSEPREPERLLISDITTEGAAVRLAVMPLGLLLHSEELAAWLYSHDVYRKGGRGPDAQRWLLAHDAKPWIIDRKGQPTISIPRAAVSVVGGVQLPVLKRALGDEHFENGLAPRLLMVMPPRSVRVWREESVDQPVLDALNATFLSLIEMRPLQDLDDGELRPEILTPSTDAKAHWVAWFNRHGQRQADADGREASLLAKAESAASRIALILHLARVAAKDPSASRTEIDLKSMQAGTALADWFANESLRVYAAMAESPEDHDRRSLVEKIKRRFSGRVTARQLRDASRRYRTPGAAEAALNDLVARGYGRWEHVPAGPSGGRPTDVFVLQDARDEEVGDPASDSRSGNHHESAEGPSIRTGPLQGEGESGAGATSSSHSTDSASQPTGNDPDEETDRPTPRSGNPQDPAGSEGIRTGPDIGDARDEDSSAYAPESDPPWPRTPASQFPGAVRSGNPEPPENREGFRTAKGTPAGDTPPTSPASGSEPISPGDGTLPNGGPRSDLGFHNGGGDRPGLDAEGGCGCAGGGR